MVDKRSQLDVVVNTKQQPSMRLCMLLDFTMNNQEEIEITTLLSTSTILSKVFMIFPYLGLYIACLNLENLENFLLRFKKLPIPSGTVTFWVCLIGTNSENGRLGRLGICV